MLTCKPKNRKPSLRDFRKPHRHRRTFETSDGAYLGDFSGWRSTPWGFCIPDAACCSFLCSGSSKQNSDCNPPCPMVCVPRFAFYTGFVVGYVIAGATKMKQLFFVNNVSGFRMVQIPPTLTIGPLDWRVDRRSGRLWCKLPGFKSLYLYAN